MSSQKITLNIFTIFLLVLFTTSIFAYNIDYSRITDTTTIDQSFLQIPQDTSTCSVSLAPAGVSSDEIISDRGGNCYTQQLPQESIEKIWNKILVSGFRIDKMDSDQPANVKREQMDNNSLLLTGPSAKAGDVTIKTEMPSKQMNPLETPALLGQTCYGSFSYGINLNKTLRVGRCTDSSQSCYLRDDGLFRQNGNSGFIEESKAVGKDILDYIGLNKAKQEVGETISGQDYDINEDLGIFTDMSLEELDDFEAHAFTDTNSVDLKTIKVIADKAIQNSFETQKFVASMETTCLGDNCYINTYSLFDKMFNQYFSMDLVISSASPLLLNFTPMVFKNLGGVKATNYLEKKLTTTEISALKLKKGGLVDELLKSSDHPFKTFERYMNTKKSLANVEGFMQSLTARQSQIVQDIQHYGLEKQYNDYLATLTSKDSAKALRLKEFYSSGEFIKLTKAQKRVFTELVQKQNEEFIVANKLIESMTSDTVYKSALKKYGEGVQAGKAPGEIISSLTKDEYDSLVRTGQKVQQIAEGLEKTTLKNLEWSKGAESMDVITSRSFSVTKQEIINGKKTEVKERISSFVPSGTQQGVEGRLGEKALGGDNAFKFTLPDPEKGGTYSLGVADKGMVKYKTETVTFSDGQTATVNKIAVLKTKAAEAPKYTTTLQDVKTLKAANRNVFVGYSDPATGAYHKVRLADFDPDSSGAVSFDIFDIKTDPLTDAEIAKYGYDPAEIAYSYVNKLQVKRLKDAGEIVNDTATVLNNQEWVTGRGINWINQKMKAVNGPIYNRFLIAPIPAYFQNWLYWETKSAGATIFGDTFAKYSMYQLPETYTSVLIKHGDTGDIYNDAYIDFFANDGSDQGDLFEKYFNSMLFWQANLGKKVLSKFGWDATDFISNWAKKLTENQIRRSTVDDIAVYTDAENVGCTDSCTITLCDEKCVEQKTLEKSISVDAVSVDANKTRSFNIDKMSIGFSVFGVSMPSYILENTSQKNLKNEGQTLIAFSHHTDYDGTLGGETTKNSVNLTDAIDKGEDCSSKLSELNMVGIPIGWTVPKEKSYRAAIPLIAEQIFAYVALGGPPHRMLLGMIVGDVIPQMTVMPQIHNCVDTEEGYYTHFFVSKDESERIKQDPKNKVGDAVSKGATSIEQTLGALTAGTAVQQVVSAGAQEVKQLAETKLKDNPIVQAKVISTGTTNGNVEGKLFFFELGAGMKCRASSYSDKGVEYLSNNDTNSTMIIDKVNGELLFTDKNGTDKIIDSAHKDFVRLIATNLGIPAKVIPHSLSYIPVPDTNSTLFTIDVSGNLSIEDSQFLDCFKDGYLAQTGNKIEGKVLTEYMGSVKLVNNLTSVTQYDITPMGLNSDPKMIVANGTPRKVAEGANAEIVINGDRSTTMSPIDSKKDSVGKNIAIQFERGQLIYNGESNTYILWVEYTAIVHQSDISGLKTEVEKFNNPVTGCEEFGLNFKVDPVKDNDQAKAKVDTLNNAFEKVGPFQMFDTPTKSFIFYTSDPPECEKRMKIIDKQTGKVLSDQAITDIIETPNGMIVKTADGATHNFEFSADDGVPKLKYNDQTETLTSAQGKNGSFWYDPETGNWYTENGHLIPFNPDFKNGATFAPDSSGKVTGSPASNPMNINIGGSGTGSGSSFNIPSVPEDILPMTLYLFVIVFAIAMIYSQSSGIAKAGKKRKISR